MVIHLTRVPPTVVSRPLQTFRNFARPKYRMARVQLGQESELCLGSRDGFHSCSVIVGHARVTPAIDHPNRRIPVPETVRGNAVVHK